MNLIGRAMHVLQRRNNKKRRIAAIGMFDGVHLGHRFLIDFLRREGEMRSLAPAVVTFREHPLTVVRPEIAPQMLTTVSQRTELLKECGVEDCILLNFSETLRRTSATRFMKRLHDDFGVDCLVVGFNNSFGHDRVSDLELLQQKGREAGIEVMKAPEYSEKGISSSAVRNSLVRGDLSSANRMLGRNYGLEGVVIDGDHLGRKLGFPTANIKPAAENLQLPAPGVYAVRVKMPDGTVADGMANIGTRPTVNGSDIRIEVNIFDYLGYLYGKRLSVEFVEFIRREQKFPSLDKLKKALLADEKEARRILSK